ncbi:Non-reducing end beta-L-arabinofuranosidase [Aquisphaera giovannonii]|uniref:Non-reducing end beta-L-arabinofuranosidase n=2 Tax=Aquisphaera giovannonii TaxID=406548 RepID=A0A5B9W2A2_9BACT|nr:Non-reducing end beta-L-arabinofuranosidase [Aquisphaera giovannonii]
MIALLAAACLGQLSPGGASPPPPVAYVVQPGLADRMEVLSPSQIGVGGWLGARIALNQKQRLLNVDTEPLLAGYRRKPGSHPWIGEHVGKWLHAATLAWANTGDLGLKAKLDRVAADLIACQEPDGYLGTYVPEKRFGLFEGADWDVWSHKYNLIGLLTYYQHTGNAPALSCCRKMADLLVATFPARKSIREAGTHVGMAATSVLEPIVLLYRFTGDPRYLDFARYIVKSWDEPGGAGIIASIRAGKGLNETANGKAYEMLSNLVGLCELARATGDDELVHGVLIRAWHDVVANRLYVTGSTSSREHFQPNRVLPDRPSANVGETCVTTTWIQFNLQLLRLTGDVRFANELDRSIYNHLAAAQHPGGDDWCYYTSLEGKKPYDAGITCCHSSGPRGMALAVQAAYFRAVRDGGDALVVNTLEDSRATATLGGVETTVTQSSGFPEEGVSVLTIHAARPARFGIRVRVPTWLGGISATAGGQAVEATPSQGWVELPAREWKDGDRVTLSFPFSPKLGYQGRASTPGGAFLSYGPFVLAYDEANNPGLPPASTLGLVEPTPKLTRALGPDLAFLGPVADRRGTIHRAVFVPFADAGATGGRYRVWLRMPGEPAKAANSLLGDGEEARSRPGNQDGSIVDGDPNSFVVTFDRTPSAEDWYSVALPSPARITRVVFRHGHSFHDGGWFDASKGRPKVQVRRSTEGPWETVGELATYPATTAADHAGLKDGQAFECKLVAPVAASAVRVIGTPAKGDDPGQAFSSCGELEAYGE